MRESRGAKHKDGKHRPRDPDTHTQQQQLHSSQQSHKDTKQRGIKWRGKREKSYFAGESGTGVIGGNRRHSPCETTRGK